MYTWKKDPNSSKSLYRQLADHIAAAIDKGELKAGSKLPSERMLSETFSLSRNTVAAAMEYLRENNYIKRIEKTGSIVTNRDDLHPAEPKWSFFEKHGRLNAPESGFLYAKGYKKGQLHLSRRHVYGELNFAEYVAANMEMQELNVAGISSDDATDKQGIYSLRESISAHMATLGIQTRPEEIAIFTSITQILNTLSNIFLNMGITYFHEKASFVNLRNMMASSGASFWGLDFDEEGLVIDKIKNRARAPKNAFLHLHSSNQNPTGITTSAARRKEIYDICSRWRIPIIEMDPMRGMQHTGDDPAPIKAMDNHGLVIYIGSFLRPTSEVLGMAWIVADEHLINTITRLKQSSDIHPNLFGQCIADSILRNGLFYRYLEQLRAHLASQLTAINEVMDYHIGDVADWSRNQSAYYLWPEFEKGINTRILYKQRHEIDFNPGFFYDPKDTSHISITTLSMKQERFDQAFQLLRRLIDKYGKK